MQGEREGFSTSACLLAHSESPKIIPETNQTFIRLLVGSVLSTHPVFTWIHRSTSPGDHTAAVAGHPFQAELAAVPERPLGVSVAKLLTLLEGLLGSAQSLSGLN